MKVLISVLKDELKAVERLELKFRKKLNDLPAGSFVVRNIGNRKYGYFNKKLEGQVIQEYIGALDSAQIAKFKKMSEDKKKYRAQLKSVKDQKKILFRALGSAAK